MPLTPFQRKVLSLLAVNRNPESYVAGATVINRSPDSPRFSRDIDLFHDPAASVTLSAIADINTLKGNGFKVEVLIETPNFVRAFVKDTNDGVKLEWTSDSAFRFFPIIPDPDLGYRLHEIDAAINKCLALAGRTEVRDVIDILSIHDTLLHLGACCWAACGKDPGFTPELILEMIARNARITPDLLAQETLRVEVDPKQIKLRWIKALDQAHAMVKQLKPTQLGCLYINKKGEVNHTPGSKDKAHYGSIRGACPILA